MAELLDPRIIEAQVAKWQAEIDDMVARRDREEKKAQAEIDKLCAEQRRIELEIAQETIELDKIVRDEALLKADWKFSHTFNFVGSVDKSSTQACIDRLHQWHVMDPVCEMTITFNSPGGSVIDGMALFDYIRFMRDAGHRITIIALGYAASMAGILLQAADVRVMARGSWLLIHEVAFGVGGKIGEVEDTYEFGKRLKEQAAQIFIERSNGKLTREHLEMKWGRKDWWLSPSEALDLGLCDEIR